MIEPFDYDDCYDPISHSDINMDAVIDHFEGVLDALYTTGSVADLENSLEEISAHLGVKFNPNHKVLLKGE